MWLLAATVTSLKQLCKSSSKPFLAAHPLSVLWNAEIVELTMKYIFFNIIDDLRLIYLKYGCNVVIAAFVLCMVEV